MTAQAVGLEQILEGAKEQGVDLVVIDTAPHSEKDARKACEVADLVLIPCRPSIHDLDAIEDRVILHKGT
jgi:chromosome partitioning protein